MEANRLFSDLWEQYVKLTPQAKSVHELLTSKGETIVNDHVAFRTYNLSPIGLNTLAKFFLDLGYQFKGEYRFEEKKLFAKHLEHSDVNLPKVFISELEVEKFSPFLQETVKKLVSSIDTSITHSKSFLTSGCPWKISHETYKKLYSESEYAAWMATFGFCANHFTVLVNKLKNYPKIEDVNKLLKEHSYTMNTSGGEIKGSPQVYLEQSSTMAAEVEVEFTDGTFKVPSCYYEFALRYKQPNGDYYSGFVEKSADKIFESTNKK